MESTNKKRSARIRQLRLDAGLTMAELGKLAGVATQTIQKYEDGTVTNIPLDRIERMAIALEVTPSYLAGWVDDPGYRLVQEKDFQSAFSALTEEKQRFVMQSIQGLRQEE